MSELKCPFCQQAIMCMDAQDADEHSIWYCPRCIAEKAWYAFGNETLWQELIRTRKQLEESEKVSSAWEIQALDYKAVNIALSGELERTRKALDVAVDALKRIKEPTAWGTLYQEQEIAEEAIEQITALEQKDK